MRIAILLLVLTACGGASTNEVVEAQESDSGDRDRAIEIARTLGIAEGYGEADYELESAELVSDGTHAGHWLVSFVHVAPAPPGGHFGVYVDPGTWQGELMHGE
jgi:hypothetical protein